MITLDSDNTERLKEQASELFLGEIVDISDRKSCSIVKSIEVQDEAILIKHSDQFFEVFDISIPLGSILRFSPRRLEIDRMIDGVRSIVILNIIY
jgi:hypothetical protein